MESTHPLIQLRPAAVPCVTCIEQPLKHPGQLLQRSLLSPFHTLRNWACPSVFASLNRGSERSASGHRLDFRYFFRAVIRVIQEEIRRESKENLEHGVRDDPLFLLHPLCRSQLSCPCPLIDQIPKTTGNPATQRSNGRRSSLAIRMEATVKINQGQLRLPAIYPQVSFADVCMDKGKPMKEGHDLNHPMHEIEAVLVCHLPKRGCSASILLELLNPNFARSNMTNATHSSRSTGSNARKAMNGKPSISGCSW